MSPKRPPKERPKMSPKRPLKRPPKKRSPGGQSQPQEAQTGPPEAPEAYTTKFPPVSSCSPCFLLLRCCFSVFVLLLFLLFFPWCSSLLLRCCFLLWVLLLSPLPWPTGLGGRRQEGVAPWISSRIFKNALIFY